MGFVLKAKVINGFMVLSMLNLRNRHILFVLWARLIIRKRKQIKTIRGKEGTMKNLILKIHHFSSMRDTIESDSFRLCKHIERERERVRDLHFYGFGEIEYHWNKRGRKKERKRETE